MKTENKSNMIDVGTAYTFVALTHPLAVKRTTFKEAFTDMFHWVQELLEGGNATFHTIETSIWIEMTSGSPLFFYDARDLACEMGILKDGKLV